MFRYNENVDSKMSIKKFGESKMKRRTISLLIALIMVLGLVPAAGITAFAAEADVGYTTDTEAKILEYNPKAENGINHKIGYDFKGFVNDEWQGVTFSDYGFGAYIYHGTGLEITSTPTFIADGMAILVEYTVKNTGNTTVSDYRFFVGADTEIAGDDASKNEIVDGVVIMTNEGKNISFFALTTTEGGVPVATEYYPSDGNNGFAQVTYFGEQTDTDPSTVTSYSSVDDSAFIIYFNKDTLAPNATKTYTLIVGMGSTSNITDIIGKVKRSISGAIDYETETLNDLQANANFEITVDGEEKLYKITSSSEGTISLSGVDSNNVEYDFTGKKISIVQKGNGDYADSDPVIMEIAGRPAAPDSPEATANDPVEVDVAGVTTTVTGITVSAVEGQEYKIGEGKWVKPDADNKVTFSNLEESTEYTIYTRIAATTSAPASLSSSGTTVKTKASTTSTDPDPDPTVPETEPDPTVPETEPDPTVPETESEPTAPQTGSGIGILLAMAIPAIGGAVVAGKKKKRNI